MSQYDFEEANDAALFFGLGDWYFMSEDEKKKLHDEKQSMPIFAEEKEAAKARIAKRISARRNRK